MDEKRGFRAGRYRGSEPADASRRPKRRRRLLRTLPVLVVALALGLTQTARGEETPEPIDPNTGEAQLLEIINSMPVKEIEQAKDNFPVPYVVIASANGAAPTIKNNRAGAPTKVDADQSRDTGNGGNDVEVEVNTELLPTPHLRLTVNRVGAAPFAPDLSVVVAFPFDAFNNEDGTDGGENPNLFFGYQTTATFDAVENTYGPGGVAPQTVEYRFFPHVLAGTDHLFELQMNQTGAANPIRYIGGHFDGNANVGIQDAIGMAALADPVPATATLNLDLLESPTASDPDAETTTTGITLGWTASAPTKMVFDYLENESFPFLTPEYNTTVTFDQMPTQESLSLFLDEGDDDTGLTLAHNANAEIGSITFLKERADGLRIEAEAAEVPTEVALTADLDGEYHLDVNANTLDLRLNAAQTGGFLDTSGFLGFDVGLLTVEVTDAPDLDALLDPDTDRFEASAANDGESIGSVGLILDDGAVPVIDGELDVDHDGDVDGDDDGMFGIYTVIDGLVDIDNSSAVDDGDTTNDVDADDDGPILGSSPAVDAVDGKVDLDDDGSADSDDDGEVTGLALPTTWDAEPTHHILSLTDNGTQGTIAGRLANLDLGGLDLDGPPVINGLVDVNGDDTVDTNDDGLVAFDVEIIDGFLDQDRDGDIDPDDTGKLFGPADRDFGPDIYAGKVDVDGDDDADSDDDGSLTMQTYEVGTTAAAPLQAFLNIKPTSTLVPGQNINATCTVEDLPADDITFNFVFPPPSFAFGYETDPPTGIDHIGCVGHFGTLLVDTSFDQLPPIFNFDFDPDEHLLFTAEDGSGPNSATLGAANIHFCDDTDLDGDCEESDGNTGIPTTGDLLGEPAIDARARADQIPSFEGYWGTGSLTIANGDVSPASGVFAGTTIAGGGVDVNDDGTVNGSDDGRFLGKRIVNGKFDVDDDGDVDGNDDGTVSGTGINYDTGRPDASLFLDGVQVDVSTVGGLPSMSPADPAADDYARFVDEGGDGEIRLAAGIFGIDEFRMTAGDEDRGVAAHYGANEVHRLIAEFKSPFGGQYFGDYATDLTLDIQDVPATIDFFTDLATELTYSASSGIDAIDLSGTIDDTNDSNDNGTVVDFDIDDLPSQVAFHLAGTVTPVKDGFVDVNGNGTTGEASDDAVIAGVRVIDGKVDLDADGTADDSGKFVGIPVAGGLLDVNEQGGVTGDDDGGVAGSTLRMNDGIPSITLELSSDNKIIETDYRRIEASLTDIPARWTVNWGGGRFLLETEDASGNPDPLGPASALVSTSNDDAENANRLNPFTLAGLTQSGPVLDASAGASDSCRIRYTEYLQQIDKEYYNAAPEGDPAGVFDRLQLLYCDSEQLDPGEDHAIARYGDVGGKKGVDFGSFQFSGFQKIAFVPDADGGHFTLRAPTPGVHPLFAGIEDDAENDEFTTLQVGNIPDSVDVEIDTSKEVTYDANDDTDASFQEIDVYSGPLPFAEDGVDATRVVVTPKLGVVDPTPQNTYIHTGWNFGFPSGGAFLDNDIPLEILLLTQDSGSRITGGLALEDLVAGYAMELFSFDVQDEICILWVPIEGCVVEIPVAWELFEARAGIGNNADGFTPASLTSMTPETLGPDNAKQAIDGFFAFYNRENSPAALVDPAMAAGGAQYVPLITLDEEGFRGMGAFIRLNLDPLSPNYIVFSIDAGLIGPTGDLVFDFWSPENIDFTDDDAIPFIPEVGFVDPPSYTDNSPIHVIPGFNPLNPFDNADFVNVHDWVYTFNGWHGFSSHFDPYK